jgi:chlorophyll synthase
MVLNDFKAIEGDRVLGIRTLPVQLGIRTSAIVACVVMALPQVVVIGLLWSFGRTFESELVMGLLGVQLISMPFFVREPKKWAPLYNMTGITSFVAGMMVSAFAMRALLG